ncbi:type I-E CRISPR-associated endoribonuclease Cas2e [Trichocoleus sp. Lan]|uniref:type I-E CRISPR-associated endoribonuclease Cas2e n=1 Tax=Trichocoleus sp. Lan TaxID=2933927 RepID=UPI00329995F8
MIVLILEKASPSLRGEVSRWLFEVKSGVFIGRISALVREELWKLISEKLKQGSATLVYPINNEQGFDTQVLGKPSRTLKDIDGLLLTKVK